MNAATGKSETFIIEGEVQSVSLKDGTAYVVIGKGSQQVITEFSNVSNIVEKTSITGKEVTATITDSEGKEQTITGEAEYIKIDSDGNYTVYVNGQFIDYDAITSVK